MKTVQNQDFLLTLSPYHSYVTQQLLYNLDRCDLEMLKQLVLALPKCINLIHLTKRELLNICQLDLWWILFWEGGFQGICYTAILGGYQVNFTEIYDLLKNYVYTLLVNCKMCKNNSCNAALDVVIRDSFLPL